MFEYEEVSEDEEEAFAREINAINKRVSVKGNYGINELFRSIGKKILNPDYKISNNLKKKVFINNYEKLKSSNHNENKKDKYLKFINLNKYFNY